MSRFILFESGRFIPSTRLGLFFHYFGLTVGLWGYLGSIPEYVLIGGLCCFLIDAVRVMERLALYGSVPLRAFLYVFVFPLLWFELGFVQGLAMTALASAILIFLVDFVFLFDRPPPLKLKNASHKRDSLKRRANSRPEAKQ